MKEKHNPVLAKETVELLSPKKGEKYVDLTVGYGGHAGLILRQTENYKDSVLVDRDKNAIEYVMQLFDKTEVSYMTKNFMEASRELLELGSSFDVILADLGLSSPHIDIASRGFSFMQDGPLDMRMDQTDTMTAADIINKKSGAEIAHILKQYGEEWQAGRIARAIVANRPYETTLQLAKTIESQVGWRGKGHHPATKTFQALRIAVNDELDLLGETLPILLQLLRPGGRLGIITFHSLEDRIVKKFFVEATAGGYDAEFRLLTKKPFIATHHEIVLNPRARSAKLRALVKIKTKKERTT